METRSSRNSFGFSRIVYVCVCVLFRYVSPISRDAGTVTVVECTPQVLLCWCLLLFPIDNVSLFMHCLTFSRSFFFFFRLFSVYNFCIAFECFRDSLYFSSRGLIQYVYNQKKWFQGNIILDCF